MRIAIYGPVNSSTDHLIRSTFSQICPFICRALRYNHQSAFVGTGPVPIFAKKSSIPFGLLGRQHSIGLSVVGLKKLDFIVITNNKCRTGKS